VVKLVSAATHDGIAELMTQISQRLVALREAETKTEAAPAATSSD
jgi:hypothetical protein